MKAADEAGSSIGLSAAAPTPSTEPGETTHAGAHIIKTGRALLVFEIAVLALALLLLYLPAAKGTLNSLSIVFVSIVLEALPFVLLGSLVSGFIEVFVPRDKLNALLPARAGITVFIAGLLGIVFPVCECAVVPVVRRLIRKGVPFSAAVTYLLAGPIVNPVVAVSTAYAFAFDWNPVVIRLLAGYCIAVAVGLLMGELFPGGAGALVSAASADAHDHTHELHGATFLTRVRFALNHAADDFLDVGRFLVLGALFAGLLQTHIDRGALALLMATPPLSIGMMMVLAVALNLCSEADAFVAASFRTIPFAAKMAFLVLGPMLDVKLLLMYLGLFRRRAIVTLATTTVVFVFATMLLMHYLVRGLG